MIGTNNICNLRYDAANNWQGQTGKTRGFCNFLTVDSCLRALIETLHSYMYRDGCRYVSEYIGRYAPESENDTPTYIENVCQWNGWEEPHYVIPGDIPDMVAAICRQETGAIVDPGLISKIFNETWVSQNA